MSRTSTPDRELVWTRERPAMADELDNLQEDLLQQESELQSDAAWHALSRKLKGFRRLQDNWDADGAIPPAPELMDTAERLVELLREDGNAVLPVRVIPTPDGAIVFEWQQHGYYREAEVCEAGRVEFLQIAPDGTSEKWEIDFREEAWPESQEYQPQYAGEVLQTA